MKKYKVKDVLQMLKKDGWYLARTKGDHRQFKHPSKPGTVTIGLTHRDISTSIHGQYNYEFLHSRGLPHCKKDDLKCLMQDAHGKNTFYMKNGLCQDCQKSLKNIIDNQ